ncbi:HesA/MoeB/ThiF family protein [Hyphomicrobium sp. 2TAF46]|uniref:HesA/MoeB/ThiF family protein n=1 Tax=Hyphomicrobium sp. 2TAF46 TaxID=3233019 RepID=UPI003F914868
MNDRYHRNILLFGEEGQHRLRQAKVTIAGAGGLGSPVAQHLALLGVGEAGLIDDEDLSESNRNRFVGARHDDPVPGSLKVALVARNIREINPDVNVIECPHALVSPEAFDLIKRSEYVIGCFDDDGPRFILNELCAAYSKHYIDLASDVADGRSYGGRVCVSWDGKGCLHCLGELDPVAVRKYLSSTEEKERKDAIYGIKTAALGQTGPSIAPLNGVIAALGVMELMVAVTGMRPPSRFLDFKGHLGTVNSRRDKPDEGCPYCQNRGRGAALDVERYLRIPHLRLPRDK